MSVGGPAIPSDVAQGVLKAGKKRPVRARAIVRPVVEPWFPQARNMHCTVKRGKKVICEVVSWPTKMKVLAADMRDSAEAMLRWLDEHQRT